MSLSRLGLTRLLGTFFGTGYLPWGPGTWGSLAGLLLAWFFHEYLLLLFLGATLAGFWACFSARKAFDSPDPSRFVIDEVAGMALSLAGLPRELALFAAAFILFRILDALKPWPISWVQNRPGSWSIMGDDLLAGLFVNLILRACLFLW